MFRRQEKPIVEVQSLHPLQDELVDYMLGLRDRTTFTGLKPVEVRASNSSRQVGGAALQMALGYSNKQILAVDLHDIVKTVERRKLRKSTHVAQTAMIHLLQPAYEDESVLEAEAIKAKTVMIDDQGSTPILAQYGLYIAQRLPNPEADHRLQEVADELAAFTSPEPLPGQQNIAKVDQEGAPSKQLEFFVEAIEDMRIAFARRFEEFAAGHRPGL